MAGEQAASGATAPIWLTKPDCTFEEALVVGREVAEETKKLLPTLPRRDASRYLPATVSDALSLVHAREDAKKKNAGNKVNKAKHKSGVAAPFGPEERIPGAVQGGGDPGAFWLYVEDFFRDATQEDLHDILPLLALPQNDSAFAIGPPGSGVDIPPPFKRPPALPPPPPPPPPPAPSASPFAPGSEGGISDALLGHLERRSSRLVSKLSRGGSAIPRLSLDDDSSMVDTEDEGPEGHSKAAAAAAAAVAAARAMTVPITAQGTPASTLWDVLPGERLALLALQLSELIEAAGIEGEKPMTQKERNAAQAAVTGQKRLNAAESSQLVLWMEARAGALSRRLNSDVEIDLLGLRRPPESRDHHHQKDKKEEEGDGQPAPSSSKAATAAGASEEAGPPPSAVHLPFSGQMHPYTRLVLQSKVPHHVQLAASEAFGIEAMLAAATGKTPTTDLLGMAGGDGQAGGLAGGTITPGAASVDNRTGGGGARTRDTAGTGGCATPAAASSMASEDGDGDDGQGTSSRPISAAGGGGRPSVRQRGVSNYALLAGRKDPEKTAAAAAARKQTRDATAAAVAQAAALHPVAQAVAQAVAAGDGDAEEPTLAPVSWSVQWNLAAADTALLAAAPQDELAAETVALQAELAAVSAANRVTLVTSLKGLIDDLPRQKEAAAARAAEQAEVIAYYSHIREEKKRELKQRREVAHREALAAAGAQKGLGGHSPRPILGHHIVEDGDGAGDGLVEAPFLGPDDMYDVLAQRGEDDEAFCAVCGDGHSHPPNVILFCDRCDVAVHQYCYDVHEVPESEWLCWPCQEYEETQRSAGVPQAEIRPPHALPDERKRLPGGARDVKCALCPIRCGAFRKTANGQQWVHQTCALWHPETYLRHSPQGLVVDGLQKIPAKRWTAACDICGQVDGAVINCKHAGTCHYNFHVMCARNCGLYLTVRPDFQGKPIYRIYCAIHSRGQQEKDARAAAARLEGDARALAAAEDKAIRAQQQSAAVAALAAREDELALLRSIRINMESTRVLADQCKRREKLKRQLATMRPALHAERMQNPLAFLGFFDKLKDMEAQGMTSIQQLEALPVLAANAGPLPPPLAPPLPVGQMHAAALADLAAPEAIEPTLSEGKKIILNVHKRQREGEDAVGVSVMSPISGVAAMAAMAAGPTPTASSPLPEGSQNKRPRRGQPGGEATSAAPFTAPPVQGPAPPPPPPPPPQQASQKEPAPRPARSGTKMAIETFREQMLSSDEAREMNSKLPPGFKFVPKGQMPEEGPPGKKAQDSSGGTRAQATTGGTSAPGSARARRAATREAVGGSPAGPSPAPSETTGTHAGAVDGPKTRSRDPRG